MSRGVAPLSYRPTSHALHTCAPATSVYWPVAQSVHVPLLAPSAKRPAAHCGTVQLLAAGDPGGADKPAPHGVQWLAAVASVPPTTRYVFAGQALHAYCSVASLYVPDGQSSHAPAPTEANLPIAQSPHTIAGVPTVPVANFPRAQRAHVGWPGDG